MMAASVISFGLVAGAPAVAAVRDLPQESIAS